MFSAAGLKKAIKGFLGDAGSKKAPAIPVPNEPRNEGSESIPSYLFNAEYFSKALEGLGEKSRLGGDYDFWVESGVEKDISASPVFDINFYRNDNSDLDEGFLRHYIGHGRFEGRSPSVMFEPDFIRNEIGDDPGSVGADLFGHWFSVLLSKRVPSGVVWDYYLNHCSHDSEGEDLKGSFVRLAASLKYLGISEKIEALIFVAIFDRYSGFRDEREWLGGLEAWIEGGCPKKFSIFFDAGFYEKLVGVEFDGGVSAYKHWYKNNRDVVPTPIFDRGFYVSKYKDLVSHPDPFLHFILHGRYEGRSPNSLFNEDIFYPEKEKGSSCALSSWFGKGMPECGLFPGLDVFLLKKLQAEDLSPTDKFTICSMLMEVFSSSFSEFEGFEVFIHSLSKTKLLAGKGKKSLVEVTKEWAGSGEPLAASYLFDKEFVGEQCGGKAAENAEAFVQWIHQYKDVDSSTAPFFDPIYYRARYLDLAGYESNVFIHYLKHGQYENRSPGPLLDTQWIAHTYDTKGDAALEFYFSAESLGEAVKPSAGMSPLKVTESANVESKGLRSIALDCHREGILDLSPDSELQQMISKAAEIEPLIKKNDNTRTYTLMPYNSDPYAYMKDLPSIVGRADILIFRDSINFGGADVILGLVYESFKAIYPGKDIKVISLGSVDEDVLADRGIDREAVVDLSEVSGKCHPDVLEHVIYDLVIGSHAGLVLNLNCGALWKVIRDYGRILSRHTRLQGYFFCDDRDPFGNVAGYPAWYFLSCSQYLEAIFLDSNYLLEEVKRRGMVVESVIGKITVLKTPYREKWAESLPVKSKQSGTRVAWAGRFDEQKRPDLLVKIAQAMPGVEFYVWGKAVLGNRDYGLQEVENMRLMGLYSSEQEILDSGCDVFLYTSEWDGVPTILLRALELNLPIVASNVGGVGELLPSDYLVDDIEDVSDYVNKLTSTLMDLKPAVEKFRAHLLMDRASRNFNSYLNALRGAV